MSSLAFAISRRTLSRQCTPQCLRLRTWRSFSTTARRLEDEEDVKPAKTRKPRATKATTAAAAKTTKKTTTTAASTRKKAASTTTTTTRKRATSAKSKAAEKELEAARGVYADARAKTDAAIEQFAATCAVQDTGVVEVLDADAHAAAKAAVEAAYEELLPATAALNKLLGQSALAEPQLEAVEAPQLDDDGGIASLLQPQQTEQPAEVGSAEIQGQELEEQEAVAAEEAQQLQEAASVESQPEQTRTEVSESPPMELDSTQVQAEDLVQEAISVEEAQPQQEMAPVEPQSEQTQTQEVVEEAAAAEEELLAAVQEQEPQQAPVVESDLLQTKMQELEEESLAAEQEHHSQEAPAVIPEALQTTQLEPEAPPEVQAEGMREQDAQEAPAVESESLQSQMQEHKQESLVAEQDQPLEQAPVVISSTLQTQTPELEQEAPAQAQESQQSMQLEPSISPPTNNFPLPARLLPTALVDNHIATASNTRTAHRATLLAAQAHLGARESVTFGFDSHLAQKLRHGKVVRFASEDEKLRAVALAQEQSDETAMKMSRQKKKDIKASVVGFQPAPDKYREEIVDRVLRGQYKGVKSAELASREQKSVMLNQSFGRKSGTGFLETIKRLFPQNDPPR